MFHCSKSPRIAGALVRGFRGVEKVEQKIKDLCVHRSLTRVAGGSREMKKPDLLIHKNGFVIIINFDSF
jgi:hypothetical protein